MPTHREAPAVLCIPRLAVAGTQCHVWKPARQTACAGVWGVIAVGVSRVIKATTGLLLAAKMVSSLHACPLNDGTLQLCLAIYHSSSTATHSINTAPTRLRQLLVPGLEPCI